MVAKLFFQKRRCFRTICFAVLLSLAGTAAFAQTGGKIPREVIDHAAAHGTVLVLVGLNVPWQMESRLSDDEARGHGIVPVRDDGFCHGSDKDEQ